MDEKLVVSIKKIKRIKKKNQFHKYIDFIQFPYYRNLEIDTNISFDFPLTVFIGQNGCGKSSCLHALYGVPDGYTPYKFWFDTKVDPIQYYDESRKRHSFWYSFQENGSSFQVIKARIKRENDPNYWETSRPLSWAGMKKRADGGRDKPIIKNVVYLDFRSELSAFDKFFYFGNLKNSIAKNKQEFIRGKSSSLKKLFTKEKRFINSSTRKLNDPVEELSDTEIYWISFILNRNYTGGLSVLHELYRNEGYSVLFETNFAKYSEAFAGSGEMAVVRLVREVLNAEQFSLILLDEPEVSLHPGAQSRLMIFLLEQIKIKKHQIVLTSHSPSVVAGLPKEAIKVFFQKPSDGRFMVKQNLSPEEAFFYIEFNLKNKRNLIVEDILAKKIIENVLKKMGDETYNLFNVEYNPGGETVIKKEFIPVYCRSGNSLNFVLLDGDQRPEIDDLDWRNLSLSKLNIDFLKGFIKEITGVDVKFSVDSGKDGTRDDQHIELLKKYLDYYKSNVYYLPKQIPEDIIWKNEFAVGQIKIVLSQVDNVQDFLSQLNEISSTKKRFAFIAKILFGDDKSENIDSVHNLFLQRWIKQENKSFQVIKTIINQIIDQTINV